jgi:hypothetical protein
VADGVRNKEAADAPRTFDELAQKLQDRFAALDEMAVQMAREIEAWGQRLERQRLRFTTAGFL